MEWKLEEAERRFGEVVRRAMDEGPQVVVSEEGREVVVVIPVEDYDEAPGFKEFLLSGPSFDDLEIRRDKSPTRIIEFDE